MTCREARVEAGRVRRKFIDKILSFEQVGTVVAMNDELLFASEETFADRDAAFFRDCLAQLLIEVAVYAVQFLSTQHTCARVANYPVKHLCMQWLVSLP